MRWPRPALVCSFRAPPRIRPRAFRTFRARPVLPLQRPRATRQSLSSAVLASALLRMEGGAGAFMQQRRRSKPEAIRLVSLRTGRMRRRPVRRETVSIIGAEHLRAQQAARPGGRGVMPKLVLRSYRKRPKPPDRFPSRWRVSGMRRRRGMPRVARSRFDSLRPGFWPGAGPLGRREVCPPPPGRSLGVAGWRALFAATSGWAALGKADCSGSRPVLSSFPSVG